MSAVTHLAGLRVEANGLLRQRCAWCGAVLFDYDLANIATPEPVEPGWLPGTAEVNGWWRVDGNMGMEVKPEPQPGSPDRFKIPEDACINIDPEVTA